MTASLSITTDLLADHSYPNSDGFKQQTFLGASIVDFSIDAGYGDSSSTLSVNLIVDEYNSGDLQGLGLGDDVYHNGVRDYFTPPPMGSPVFFKFGTKHASIDEAFRKTYDDIYNYAISNQADNPGHLHLAFGGILQAINESKGFDGNPKYSAQIVDPREILSNVQLILNNYAGTTYNNANMYNIYGFLEYNLPENYDFNINDYFNSTSNLSNNDELKRIDRPDGTSTYVGTDMRYSTSNALNLSASLSFSGDARFPITGTGFSRRSSQGIPFYRVNQAINALFGIHGQLPDIYKRAGFGGYINFRGFNYIVDFSGLPELDQFYFIDYDQISLLDLALEICQASNHELFVSLLPIISHPICNGFKNYNDQCMINNKPEDMIAGIIRIDTIDRSIPQPPNSIKSYLDNLEANGIEVTNKNLGTELSNVNTDKFIVGANEVEMYYFSANADRKEEDVRLQWTLNKSLEQQILPYYGLLPGNSKHPETVTIPKGYGSYQQILLDSSSLNAVGVGNFYVATEIELRAALVSFERWSRFLLMYDNVYMESTESNDIEEGLSLELQIPADHPAANGAIPLISNNYAVSVPRSVWPSDEPGYDSDGLPLSPCNPPYGYPLYYKRATQIGIPTTGASAINGAINNITRRIAEASGDAIRLNNAISSVNGLLASFINSNIAGVIGDFISPYINVGNLPEKVGNLASSVISYFNNSRKNAVISDNDLALLSDTIIFNRQINQKSVENAKKVYDFVKSVADECLGKKFLVKIPRQVNIFYEKDITVDTDNNIITGPFGFAPLSIDKESTVRPSFSDRMTKLGSLNTYALRTFLNKNDSLFEPEDNYAGALSVNYNPISSQYEFNYMPEPNGGYYEYDLLSNFSAQKQPLHISQGLAPQDATLFDLGNNRISAYVRFDNSQDLSFNGFSSDSITQQINRAGYFVPDLTYTLNNLTPGRLKDLPPPTHPKPKQVTFVKVNLDSKFYMPPVSAVSGIGVHGREIIQEFTISRPQQIFDAVQCKYVDSLQYSTMVAIPKPVDEKDAYKSPVRHFVAKQSYGSIQYEADTDHVYALITLPNRVVPTVDSRLRDGNLQKFNAAQIKHFLAADVVRGVDGFEEPAIRGTPTDLIGDFLAQPLGDDVSAAVDKSREMLSFALPNKIEFTTPSPVYPDMVALPLLSKEKCYGPWISSQVGSYVNIGGKIEYIKDENLAPWNFSGYTLMNKAGLVQAQFSNSLLLSSERGSFSIPMAPSGIALGKSLSNAGPLVSNISVNVSANGVTTDYRLDLYTAKFGKIQKQRLDNISKISRNQQKLEDERNALIRKGFGKNQTNISLQNIYNSLLQNIKNIKIDAPTQLQSNPNSQNDYTVMSVLNQFKDYIYDENADSTQQGYVAGSQTNINNLQEASDMFQHDSLQLNASVFNSASSHVNDGRVPASLEPGHPNMPSVDTNSNESTYAIYQNIDGWDDSTISNWNTPIIRSDENGIV